jgi:hypothetical protein
MRRTPAYPSIIINGSHPGPESDYYLVENAHIAKDYWWFKEKRRLCSLPGKPAFMLGLRVAHWRKRSRNWRRTSY